MKPRFIIQGRIPQQSMPAWTLAIAPLILVKRGIAALQLALQRLVWAELIHNETIPNNLFQTAVFVAFCIFCLLSYFAKNAHLPWILIGAALTGLERWLAQQAYYNAYYNGKGAIATLEKAADTYQWELTDPNGNRERQRFDRNQLERIVIRRTQIYVGFSEAPIALVWQISLQLADQSLLPIATEFKLGTAIASMRALSQELQIPFVFTQNELIQSNPLPGERHSLAPSITCRTTAKGWQMVTGWTIADGWRLIGKVWDRAGLLLFAILFAKFSAQFGDFLVRMFVAWREEGVILLDVSPLFQILNGFSGFDWLGMAIALGMMLWEGARLSMVKQLICDRDRLRLQIAQHQVASISTDVEGIVFLPQPTPLLAIWDRNNQAIELTDLPRLDDYRAISLQVSQTLLH